MNENQQQLLIDLVNIHLNPDSYNDKDVVKKTASLFLFSVNDFINKSSGETFYKLPYKDISNILFQCEFDFLSETFTSFTETVLSEMEKAEDYINSHEQEHIKECYAKFAQHISLVLVQKKFILEISKKADKAAEDAKTAAEKAKKMQEDMMVNYITILGVFASIIITVFGGISLTNASVKLLESDFDLPLLVFVISLLMFGFLSILIVLITWISSLRSSTFWQIAPKWGILCIFGFLSVCSGIYLNKKIHTGAECQIGYYTCLHMDELKEPYLKNNTENEEN